MSRRTSGCHLLPPWRARHLAGARVRTDVRSVVVLLALTAGCVPYAIPPAQVERSAARLLDPAAATIVVVGDAKQFLEPMRKAYPSLEVIPVASLNLERAGLR